MIQWLLSRAQVSDLRIFDKAELRLGDTGLPRLHWPGIELSGTTRQLLDGRISGGSHGLPERLSMQPSWQLHAPPLRRHVQVERRRWLSGCYSRATCRSTANGLGDLVPRQAPLSLAIRCWPGPFNCKRRRSNTAKYLAGTPRQDPGKIRATGVNPIRITILSVQQQSIALT